MIKFIEIVKKISVAMIFVYWLANHTQRGSVYAKKLSSSLRFGAITPLVNVVFAKLLRLFPSGVVFRISNQSKILLESVKGFVGGVSELRKPGFASILPCLHKDGGAVNASHNAPRLWLYPVRGGVTPRKHDKEACEFCKSV